MFVIIKGYVIHVHLDNNVVATQKRLTGIASLIKNFRKKYICNWFYTFY
jgi:hypothetical protein